LYTDSYKEKITSEILEISVEQNNPKAGLYLLCPEGQNKGQMQGR
jgi:hypothetical protein